MIVVNPSTRQFNIPGADLVFGVESDSGSVRKYFQCPRHVGNNLDLAASFIRINYRNANGEIDSYLVQDVAVDGDNVTFSWLLSPKTTMYKGQISFVMCVVGPDTKVQWHTTLGRGQVLEGLEPDSAVAEEGTTDVVAALISMVEAQTTAVEEVGEEQISKVKAAAETAQAAAVAEIEAKRVNTLASIPADYASLSDAVDGIARTAAPGIECSAEGEVITLNDASNQALRGLRIFGRSTQDGIPTPENPVEIVSVENPTISVGEQTVSIPRTLCGIPVPSGGNYTDENGQQWICDEVDFARGVYVQRIYKYVYTGKETWEKSAIQGDGLSAAGLIRYDAAPNPSKPKPIRSNVIATHCLFAAPNAYVDGSSMSAWVAGEANISYLAIRIAVGFDTTEDLKAWLVEQNASGSPFTVLYALAKNIETPLSETELAAYRSLHTNKPNTTILNDSGAHMKVDYTADTKLYIDNKIAALMGN